MARQNRTPGYLLLFLLLTPFCYAQKSPPSSPAITAGEIFGHVKYLASDRLEGRGTGTKGGAAAATYIGREFRRYGLKPAGLHGTYMQQFEVVTGLALGGKNRLQFTGKAGKEAFSLKEDFIPLSFSEYGEFGGGVVFAGFGISAPKLDYDEYAAIDARKKIVLIFSGRPADEDPRGDFSPFGGLRAKALYAREAGASALLVVRPDTSDKNLYDLKYDNSPSTAGIPCISITRAAADRILHAANTTVSRLFERLSTEKKSLSFAVEGVDVQGFADVKPVRKPTDNIVGLVEGSDPVLRDRVIVVGAHYDHLGWGQEGSLYRGSKPMIHNGADDNASGTAAVLELAQYFAAHPEMTKRTLAFVSFAGEEMGLLGSAKFVENPPFPLARIDAMINLDMVGRMPDSTLELNVQGVGTSPVWKDLLTKYNEKYGFALKLVDDGQGPSDHAAFYQKNLPVLFFFNGLHSDYHKPSDDYEKINAKNEQAIISFVADIVADLSGRSEKPAFVKVKPKDEGRKIGAYKVYVGTIPDFGATEKGFKISGVSEGSPAEKAGLKGGDIIIRFGETNIQSIYDYMGALGMHKAGEDVPVTVKRGEETKVLTVRLEKK